MRQPAAPPRNRRASPPPAVAAEPPPRARRSGSRPAQPPKRRQSSPREPPAGTDIAAAPPPETTAPKLVSVQGSVIIRRGDTLWRISRRVYGRGMRYSTIYLANQAQIADPDRIWPGQVFRFPKRPRKAIRPT